MLAKNAARMCMDQYDVTVKQITFIGRSEHVTHRIDTVDGERYLLRIHNSHLSGKEIESELLWLEFLASCGMPVPRGKKNKKEQFVSEVNMDGTTIYATLLKWIDGRFVRWELKPKHIRQAAELMAKLHWNSMMFQPDPDFVRPVWEEESLRRDADKLSGCYSAFMALQEYQRVTQAVDRIADCINSLLKTPETYGVIHADLHWGNIIYHQGEARAIDFGRCGYGFHMYDISQSLIGLHPGDRRIFVEEYMAQRGLPAHYQQVLECFFIMSCIENISFHSTNPEEFQDLNNKMPYITKLVNGYLEGKPFLFGTK